MKYYTGFCRNIQLIILICAAPAAFGQSLKVFTDCDSIVLHQYYKGDTVLVHCDTAMLMNLKTFVTYKKSFDKLIRGNASVKDLVSNYENTIRIQGSMLVRQEDYYQQVKSKLDSLSGASLSLADNTSSSLKVISASLGKANDQLVETKSLLMESQKMLKEDQRKSFARKLKIGLGGFGIGVGVTTLLFLVSR